MRVRSIRKFSSVYETARVRLNMVFATLALGLVISSSPVCAGTIDTLPKDGDFATSGSLAQGGTFVADDTNLAEFTINIGMSVGGLRARPVVLGTTLTGAPTLGPVLWEGVDLVTPLLGDFTFLPNIPLNVGERYFIGLDYGGLTSVAGDVVLFGSRFDDPISNGQGWRLFESGWDSFSPGVDIAARIVMTPIPEPSTYAMMLAGLAVLGWASGRRTCATS